KLQHQHAGAAAIAGRLGEKVAQIRFRHAVNGLKLLLLQKLAPVLRYLAPGRAAMLSRRIRALERRALGRTADGLADPPANAVLRSGQSCHSFPILQYPPVMFASSHGNIRGSL